MKDEIKSAFGYAALKTSPPVAVSAMTGEMIVTVLTAAYVVLQAAYLVWKWRKEAKAK